MDILRKPAVKLLLLSVLSGVLMICTWRPPEPPWTLAFCFVPLWYYWMGNPGMWRVFLSGWIAQFVFSAGAFYWVAQTADLFFGAPGIQAYLYLVAFSCVAHISYPVAGVCWYFVQKKLKLSRARTLILLVLTTEFFDMFFPRIFPLNFGDVWMWSGLEVAQLADITGFAGLGLLTYALNAIWLSGGKPWRALALNSAVVAAASGLGALNVLRWSEPDANIKAHVLQVFIEPIEMIMQREGAKKAIEITIGEFFNRNRTAFELGKPDLMIWSETAMPFDVGHESEYISALQKYVRDQGVPLLTGGYRYNDAHVKHNSAALFAADGRLLQTYDKHMLMPFGEYLPLENYFPIVRQWAPNIPVYGSGKDFNPIVLRDARMGPSICYESLFPDHYRQLTNAGANVFFNITSDAWFGKSTEAYMHGYGGLERAIEFRRPMIRVGDTGLTTVVLADGTQQENPPIWELWQSAIDVPFITNPPHTIFDTYGRWWPWLTALVWAGVALYPQRAPKAKTRRNLKSRSTSKAA